MDWFDRIQMIVHGWNSDRSMTRDTRIWLDRAGNSDRLDGNVAVEGMDLD